MSIPKGFFPLTEPMPCAPKAIRIMHWALPSTLGRAEQEEAAARILSFSQKIDQWVGVSWHTIVEMMQNEMKEARDQDIANGHIHTEKIRVWSALRKRCVYNILTLGLYGLFVPKPTEKIEKAPGAELPFSGIFVFGPEHVATGIQELIGRDMLRLEERGEGKNMLQVFFPTPALVSLVMEKQGIAA